MRRFVCVLQVHVDRCLSIRVCSVGVLCCVASLPRARVCACRFLCMRKYKHLNKGIASPPNTLKSPWPGGGPTSNSKCGDEISRFKFRGCCLNKRTWMIPIHTRHVRMHACHAACHAHEINFIRYSPQPFWFSPCFSHLTVYSTRIGCVRFDCLATCQNLCILGRCLAFRTRRLSVDYVLTLRGFLGYRVCWGADRTRDTTWCRG